MAEAGVDKNYKFDLDLAASAADFNSKAGEYSVSVIVGDAVISNPVSWAAATISINFPETEDDKAAGPYDVKPEITHMFRLNIIVSNFCLLTFQLPGNPNRELQPLCRTHSPCSVSAHSSSC